MMTTFFPIAFKITSESNFDIIYQESNVKPPLKLGKILNFKVIQTGNLTTASPTSFNMSW
jgi:hypothetical protein